MNETLTPIDRKLLELCARTRCLWPEILVAYSWLKLSGSVDAIRKRLERLCDKGFLAQSKLPNGLRVFRLSLKGVSVVGAPQSFATSPTLGIAVEMLSVATFAAKPEEFLFPTNEEMDSVLSELTGGKTALRVPGRFMLRLSKSSAGSTKTEARLHYWLAEPPKPADKVAKRVQVVFDKLTQNNVIGELVTLGLFGFTIVVPSEGFRATLNTYRFPTEIEVVVLPALQTLFIAET